MIDSQMGACFCAICAIRRPWKLFTFGHCSFPPYALCTNACQPVMGFGRLVIIAYVDPAYCLSFSLPP